MSSVMNVIEVVEPGEAYRLEQGQRPVPEPGEHDVLIKVAAAGVNRADIFQAQGSYPPPEGVSDILGLEVAGEVVALGEKAKLHQLGDTVCALLPGGGYAEYVAAAESEVLPVPQGLSPEEAAAVPEVFCTAYLNVLELGRLKPGEAFLMHGGASGVGSAAIQLAKHFGAQVFATARGEEKCAACTALGADRAIDYVQEDFVAVVKEMTEGKGVDVIVDMVGGEYVQRNLSALGLRGRLISIAFLEGAKMELNLAPVLMKELTMMGSRLRSRSALEKNELMRALYTVVWPLLASQAIKPVVDKVFPFSEADAAHAYMRAGEHIGKIVLQMDGS